MFQPVQSIILILFGLLLSSPVFAVSLNSYCAYSVDQKRGVGENADEALAIASVSKILTSQWALAVLGAKYQFSTKVHVTPVNGRDGFYNIHIQGSHDPYFSKDSMHLMVSELNKVGITKIATLSFDENVKFVWNIRSDGMALEEDNTFPTVEHVTAQFNIHKPFLAEYGITAARMNKARVNMVAAPKFTVEKVIYWSEATFKTSPLTKTHVVKSAPLINLLKEMNHNSNNVTANIIFDKLGGSSAYSAFAENIGIKNNKIVMLNGSGGPYMVGIMKSYNKASCNNVLDILGWLHKYLNDPSLNLGLKALLALPGEGNDNTVGKSYSGPMLDKVLIAKTGTVCQVVTLAGVASTVSGPVLFYYNMKTGDANGNCKANYRSEWRTARVNIKAKVTHLINSEFGGGQPTHLRDLGLLSYDYRFE